MYICLKTERSLTIIALTIHLSSYLYVIIIHQNSRHKIKTERINSKLLAFSKFYIQFFPLFHSPPFKFIHYEVARKTKVNSKFDRQLYISRKQYYAFIAFIAVFNTKLFYMLKYMKVFTAYKDET